jgi:hypothetical protein
MHLAFHIVDGSSFAGVVFHCVSLQPIYLFLRFSLALVDICSMDLRHVCALIGTSRMLTRFSAIKCSGESIDRFEEVKSVVKSVKPISRRAAAIGFASAAALARFAPTMVFAEDISNATVGSDQVGTILLLKVHGYVRRI